MLFFVEKIVLQKNDLGDLRDEYLDKAANVFGEAVDIIREHHLTGKFPDRCKILAAEFYETGYDIRDVTSDFKDGFKDKPSKLKP